MVMLNTSLEKASASGEIRTEDARQRNNPRGGNSKTRRNKIPPAHELTAAVNMHHLPGLKADSDYSSQVPFAKSSSKSFSPYTTMKELLSLFLF